MHFIERPADGVEQDGESAILVHVDMPGWDRQDLAECELLVQSAGAQVVTVFTTTRQQPDARHFIGSGKVDEVAAAVSDFVAAHDGKRPFVVVNHPLSPAQERNLERALQCRVLDRTGLILDIFAQRARTFEGRLQVELAQLRHLSTRLVRGWTHLERQKGGIGLRGPGESQLETDRRLIRARIQHIEERLEKVRVQREQGRRARLRNDVATISLVGYTNAGKSTLFNRLGHADVLAQDQLFATLDPTLRRFSLDRVGDCVLADTVGFIRQLPHQLVAAFKATLEETTAAKLLLHVVDAASADRHAQMKAVQDVLVEIGADNVPVLVVMNKIDLLPSMAPHLERDEDGRPVVVWLSARTGDGLNLLEKALSELLDDDRVEGWLQVDPQCAGAIHARLCQWKALQQEHYGPDGAVAFHIAMERKRWQQLRKQFDLAESDLLPVEARNRETYNALPNE